MRVVAVPSLLAVFRDDYLMRLIKQLADFIARAAGFNRKGEHEKALQETARAWSELLHDIPHELVDVVDTATLASMLREPQRMRVAAQLLVEEGRALRGKGDPPTASMRTKRAIELYLEARAISPEADDQSMIFELSREVHGNQLDERYRTTR